MDNKKIAKFILTLRKEKGLTQEELADLIPIGRAAVSKWERGITIPDSSVLLRLSEIFKVNINEILLGERINSQNKEEANKFTLDLFTQMQKGSKNIKLLIIGLLILLFLFLSYYFISSYKKIRVYTINNSNEFFEIDEGMLIRTKNKTYFKIGKINPANVSVIFSNIGIYYLDKDKKEHLLFSVKGNEDIVFEDINNKYFQDKEIKQILDNLYIRLIYNEVLEKSFKLEVKEDYVNKEIIFNKNSNDINSLDYFKDVFKNNKEYYLSYINSLIYLKKQNIFYNENNKSDVLELSYQNNILNLSLFGNGLLKEQWKYNLDGDNIDYSTFNNGIEQKLNCSKDDCQESFFWQKLKEAL